MMRERDCLKPKMHVDVDFSLKVNATLAARAAGNVAVRLEGNVGSGSPLTSH